jgi:hypothetical protein
MDKKSETGAISITGQYCKYPDNDFIVLPIQLFQDKTHVKNDTIEFSTAAKFENLPYGKYSIHFQSMFEQQETLEFELKNKVQEVAVCVDKIDYQLSNNDLLIDQLKANESLKIDFKSHGCFHFNKSEFIITQKDNRYLAKLDKTEIVLTPNQLELVREFEIELRNIPAGGCTTSHTYNLEILGGSESFEFIDNSCDWRGYNNLLAKLGLEITTANKT